MRDWAGERVGLAFIPPGQPWRNGYIESCVHGRLRDECLNINSFWSLTQARVVISGWKTDYNHCRHSALRYQTPADTLQPAITNDRLSYALDRSTGSRHFRSRPATSPVTYCRARPHGSDRVNRPPTRACNESSSAATTPTTTPVSYRTDCRCSTNCQVPARTLGQSVATKVGVSPIPLRRQKWESHAVLSARALPWRISGQFPAARPTDRSSITLRLCVGNHREKGCPPTGCIVSTGQEHRSPGAVVEALTLPRGAGTTKNHFERRLRAWQSMQHRPELCA